MKGKVVQTILYGSLPRFNSTLYPLQKPIRSPKYSRIFVCGGLPRHAAQQDHLELSSTRLGLATP